MIFVQRNEFDSTYRQVNGTLVSVKHGIFTKYDLDAGTLAELWDSFPTSDFDAFTAHLRQVVVVPDMVDDVVLCEDHDEPIMRDDSFTVDDGYRIVCESCLSNYWRCDGCEDHFESTTSTLEGNEVCERCRDYNYSYCEDCDGYYRDGYGCGTDHEQGCERGCEAPHMRFVVRNGEGTLRQDERAVVSLPAGVISAEGVAQISNAIRTYAREAFPAYREDGSYDETAATQQQPWHTLSYTIEQIGETWQTKQGNYTKRLSRHAHKTLGLKVPAELLTKIGNIGSANSQGSDFQLEVTRDFNMSAEDFYHEDSCWWQSYFEGRCALKTNGGIGMRTFSSYGSVSGRAWCQPLKVNEYGDLAPTHDAVNAVAFVIFNGYGDLSGYAAARIVAHQNGMTYRKIGLTISPMYVNGEAGYIVGAEETVDAYTDGHLSLDFDQHANLRESVSV